MRQSPFVFVSLAYVQHICTHAPLRPDTLTDGHELSSRVFGSARRGDVCAKSIVDSLRLKTPGGAQALDKWDTLLRHLAEVGCDADIQEDAVSRAFTEFKKWPELFACVVLARAIELKQISEAKGESFDGTIDCVIESTSRRMGGSTVKFKQTLPRPRKPTRRFQRRIRTIRNQQGQRRKITRHRRELAANTPCATIWSELLAKL